MPDNYKTIAICKITQKRYEYIASNIDRKTIIIAEDGIFCDVKKKAYKLSFDIGNIKYSPQWWMK